MGTVLKGLAGAIVGATFIATMVIVGENHHNLEVIKDGIQQIDNRLDALDSWLASQEEDIKQIKVKVS